MLPRWLALLGLATLAANVALAGYFLVWGGPIWCLVLSLAAGLAVIPGIVVSWRSRGAADRGDAGSPPSPNTSHDQATPAFAPKPAEPPVEEQLQVSVDSQPDPEPRASDAEPETIGDSKVSDMLSAGAAGPSSAASAWESDPLRNQSWVNLIEEVVEFFDEVDRLRSELDPAEGREFAGHVCCRLVEILERSGVTIISNETVFDRARHVPQGKVVPPVGGDAIIETVSPGFAVGRRVFRRALVRLADPNSSSPGDAS